MLIQWGWIKSRGMGSQFGIQSKFNYSMHVVILVLCQTSPKRDILQAIRQSLIVLILLVVLFVIHRIKRFQTRLPLLRELSGNNGLRLIRRAEILMLYDSCEGMIMIRVIHGDISLETLFVQYLLLKP